MNPQQSFHKFSNLSTRVKSTHRLVHMNSTQGQRWPISWHRFNQTQADKSIKHNLYLVNKPLLFSVLKLDYQDRSHIIIQSTPSSTEQTLTRYW